MWELFRFNNKFVTAKDNSFENNYRISIENR